MGWMALVMGWGGQEGWTRAWISTDTSCRTATTYRCRVSRPPPLSATEAVEAVEAATAEVEATVETVLQEHTPVAVAGGGAVAVAVVEAVEAEAVSGRLR